MVGESIATWAEAPDSSPVHEAILPKRLWS
jgi:hypothetical protein